MSEIEWKLYAWVIRGRQRRRVVEALNRPKLPSEMKRELSMSLTNVSKTLKSLEERGIVECLTPSSTTGRIYDLTKKGRAIREEMTRQE